MKMVWGDNSARLTRQMPTLPCPLSASDVLYDSLLENGSCLFFSFINWDARDALQEKALLYVHV